MTPSPFVQSFKRYLKAFLLGMGSLFTILLFVVYALFQWGVPSRNEVHPNSILTLTLSGPYAEYVEEDSFSRLFMPFPHSLHHVVKAVEDAGKDPKIVGLLIRLDENELGIGMIQQLRKAIQMFRASGKPAYIFADTLGEGSGGTKDYYLASCCDQIWLQPLGNVSLTGLGIEIPFLRNLLSLIGVRPDIEKRWEFKSAPEMFTENTLLPATQESYQSLLDSLSQQIAQGIAECREIKKEAVVSLMENGPFLDEDALSAHLIDKIGSLEDLRAHLKERFGKDSKFVSLNAYYDPCSDDLPEYVAVYYASGEIVRDSEESQGNSLENATIGGYKTAKELRKIADDKHAKALVLRIDSPGGSSVASETIWQALTYVKKSGKPVVVSMGDTAASGGYWIATAADRIVAHPGTLTGSIGVYGGKFSIEELSKKVGINWGRVATAENALAWSVTTPFSGKALEKLNASLDQTYERFLQKVATARNMSKERVHEIARGRVWTGEQALENGLVDKVGDLNTAIEWAFELCGGHPEDLEVRYFPHQKRFAELLLDALWRENTENEPFIGTAFRTLSKVLKALNALSIIISSASPQTLRSPLEADTIR